MRNEENKRQSSAGVLAMGLSIAVFGLAGLLVRPAKAQTVTSNAFVAAKVGNQNGIIGIYLAGTNPKAILTNRDHSYLTIQIGNDYYTNNDNSPTVIEPSGATATPISLTTGGTTQLVHGKIPGTDTIQTIWQPKGPGAFDIVQDVYPVAGISCGQIVYKWSIVNHEDNFLNVQVQYLLDIATSSNAPTYSTEAPAVTTRKGYNSDRWQDLSNTIPYFITSEYDLSSNRFPGILGAGYTVDDLAPFPMNLMQPADVEVVDWPVMAETLWGVPSSMGTTMADGDNAMLLLWPSSGVAPNSEQEIGRGSYGTPPCQPITLGNLDALLLHVEHIVWTGSNYMPSTFPVEAILWDPKATSAHGAVATQTITSSRSGAFYGPVKITTPTPVLQNGYSQSHPIQGGGSIIVDSAVGTLGAAYATWEDAVNPVVNCLGDSSYNITLSLTAKGTALPIFSSSVVCPILVDCQEQPPTDVTPPGHSEHRYSDNDSCGHPIVCTIYSVYDNRPSDQGVQSITYKEAPTNSVRVVIPPFSGCPPIVGAITMTQTDTLQDACVYFTYTDCANNVSYDTVCFGHCIPGVSIDTIPPAFHLERKFNWNVPTDSSCGFKCSDWTVTDTVQNALQRDAGLAAITTVSSSNMLLTPLAPVTRGMPSDSFTVCVIDSMLDGTTIVEATDATGLSSFDTISYCTVADTLPPKVTVGSTAANQWPVHVTDSDVWDRGVRKVLLTNVTYCTPLANPGIIQTPILLDSTAYGADWLILPADSCAQAIDFKVAITDSFETASFTIQAIDCASKGTFPSTYRSKALADVNCPQIDTASLTSNELSVSITDTSTPYEEGVDSVWFTCANNITLDSAGTTWISSNNTLHTLHGKPTGGDHPKFQRVLKFTLYVTNDTLQDVQPCVCINAIDGAGHLLCSPLEPTLEWCAPVKFDNNPPNVTAIPTCTNLALVVTDSLLNDLGVYRVWLDSVTNFSPLDDSSHGGAPAVPFTLSRPDPNASSYARLSAIDLYGHRSSIPATKAKHTTSTDIWVYKQDLAMNGSGIVNDPAAGTTTNFSVPVFLAKTDTIPLAQKQLSQFQFQFHLTGSTLVSFVGTKASASLAGWTITPVPGSAPPGPPYLISGFGPPLSEADTADTLLYLLFSAASIPPNTGDVEETRIVIDSEQCGAQVLYNGGADTTLADTNYNITVPAPSGRMMGGTIILKDSCAPIVGNHPNPTILSIAPIRPNPMTNASAAVIRYTVPAEAPVVLALYDELGRNVRTLVNEVQGQGTYQIPLESSVDDRSSTLDAGTYFLRLASGGNVCDRQIIITK